MLQITRQWAGATLLSNGLLILDPVAFLEGRGIDPGELGAEVCEEVVTRELDAAGALPCSKIQLTDPTWN